MITFSDIRKDQDIITYIEQADASLNELGYTEHSFPHVLRVAETAKQLLLELGYAEREAELAQIAGYLHDIGNLVNRVDHSQSGALMAFRILDKHGMNAGELSHIVTAIGNHDEGTGVPVSPIAAALILADKSDVRRSRVRNTAEADFDIHDRVNYSVTASTLKVNSAKTAVTLALEIDTRYSPVMEFFEIFTNRMTLCRMAAKRLHVTFHLNINGQALL